MEEFKVGDEVIWLPTGKQYKIMASKEVPYMLHEREPIFPNEGMDFVLIESKIKNGETIYFQHVDKELLTLLIQPPSFPE